MLQKRDYVRYACEGGLYLWDNECQVRWHNLSTSDRTDWLLFFDVCREEPTVYTEAIIAAIMSGLCPLKTKAFVALTPSGIWGGGVEGVDWANRKVWYLREDRNGFGANAVPESTRKPAAYYLDRQPPAWPRLPPDTRATLVPVVRAAGRHWKRFRQRAWKVHKFDHYFDAWRFLFQFI